jgi:hypothetical protein
MDAGFQKYPLLFFTDDLTQASVAIIGGLGFGSGRYQLQHRCYGCMSVVKSCFKLKLWNK